MSVPTSSTDPLRTVSEQFAGVVAQVLPTQWELPTPCDDWSIRELVGHVVSGSQMATAVAAGASRNEAIGILATDFLGDDPNAAVQEALTLQHTALDYPELNDRICHHPAGDMPGSQLIGFRITDLVVHQWDLARAIGADETLDPDVVQIAWDAISPMGPVVSQLGVFGEGPSGNVADDAPLQERLLDLIGRRP